MPPEKSWEIKKIENWGNIFGGKLPKNAWHRMRQFCVQQLQFFSARFAGRLIVAPYFQGLF